MPLRVESISEEQSRKPIRKLHLLYHELRNSESKYSYVTEATTFERHVDLYVRLREENVAAVWPELTFDDGHVSNYEIADPILKLRGITARFFITAGWTGNKQGYMRWEELRALHESGQMIGAHGWTHTLLTHCSDRDLQEELVKSRLTLEDKLGVSITTMSLPGGRYNRRVLGACEEAGYTQVYTSAPRAETVPLGMMVGRLNILGSMQPEWIAKLFEPESRVLSGLNRQYRMKDTAKTLLGDRLYEKLWSLVNRREPEAENGEGSAE